MKKYVIGLSLLSLSPIFAEVIKYEADVTITASTDNFSKAAIVGKAFYEAEVAAHKKCEDDGGTYGESKSYIINVKMFKHCTELENNEIQCQAKGQTQCYL